MKKPRRPRRTHFVPSVVFGTVFVGVIPTCVTACGGGSTTTSSADASSDAVEEFPNAVAACAFQRDACAAAVAQMGFDATMDVLDSGDATDATQDDGPMLGVADIGFTG